jgi:Cu2+-exporting ATPase
MTGSRHLSYFVRHLDGGVARMEFEVEGLFRAGCTQTIEGGLAAIPDTTSARVSLADRRVAVEWRDGKVNPVRFIDRLSELGFEAHPCDAAEPNRRGSVASDDMPAASMLLWRAGAAALAAVAVKLLSAAMAAYMPGLTLQQRDLVHGLSAAITFVAAAWAGRPLFMSAARASAAGRLSREAPVSAAILLAFGLSVSETLGHAVQTSYHSGLVLLAVALAVRALEAVLRRAPAATGNRASPAAETVTKFVSDTELADVPAGSLRPGDLILVRPGERIAVDGVVTDGRSEVDQSRVSGETLPVPVAGDSAVFAGTFNVSGTLRVRAGAGRGTLLGGVIGLDDHRTTAPARWAVHPSDRIARLYPPLALAAAGAALAVRAAFGTDWHDVVTAAIAVLALSCPAAFGLAASAVTSWSARALSQGGVRLQSEDGIERLARVDTILFDKTGTLTVPEPEVVNTADIPPERLAVAGRLALASRHPLAAAVVRAAGAAEPIIAVEEPGQGVSCIVDGVPLRLGRPSFCDAERQASAILESDPEASVIAFACGAERHVLAVRQRLRGDAIETVARLKQDGFAVEIVSGDRSPAVAHAASTLGIEGWYAGMTPADKIGHISVLQAQGRTVLMVGDGLNDAPSLSAADAALSVGTAVPSVLAAADAVFAGDRLAPVPAAIAVAHQARQMRRQNLWLAAACMAVALPAAVLGFAGPLAAALAMGGVAAAVTLNAMRVIGPPEVPNGQTPA